MKIWYQSYSTIGSDPRWRYYEEALERHTAKIARSDTRVDIRGAKNMAPKMLQSTYFQYLHLSQIVENALQAEREGYDAFVLGGMRDIGYSELREVVEIPVTFSGEACYYVACLLAPKFSVIFNNEVSLRAITGLIKHYGLEERYVPGAHIGVSLLELVESFEKNPRGVIDKFTKAAKKVIEQDAGVMIPGFGGLSVFLAEQGINEIDGVPVLDSQAAVIKMAEVMVDLKRLGINRSKTVPYHPSKEEVTATRKLYGVG